VWILPFLAVVAICTGCGGSESGSSGGSTAGSGASPATGITESPAATATPGEPSSLPPGAQAGLDDYDGDGTLDPTCGTQDFTAGLVLRIPCAINTANGPESGTRLVKDSLYRLPGSTDIDLTGISGSLVLARDSAGAKVFIVFFNTDALFETGSDAVGSTDTLDNTIRLINERAPGGTIQVRGHTDATGSVDANRALSERRARTVENYLRSHGVNASTITSVGLGSAQPLVEETNPDGSPSIEGRRFNRRVELVIRLRR
jgi:outer membrane protein OmpA-like peptidoglycan-associated protein